MKKKVVFLGGDRRELAVMRRLLSMGHQVEAYGWPEAALPIEVAALADASASLRRADACIMPLPPLLPDGKLHTMTEHSLHLEDHTFATAREGMVLLCGIITPHLRCIAQQCALHGMMEEEELARPLAEAAAEGALAEAIRLSNGVLFDETALVIGYGRIGRALAWRLEALGMRVTVLNRGALRRAEARDYGLRVGEWEDLNGLASRAGFIFNTAPAPLLGRDVLQWLDTNTLIIDLAASPGGTDFGAAAEYGIKAVLAGGLPGRYAPRFSGDIMADVYTRRLENWWGDDGYV